MARYEKYETKKGIRWKYIVETGVNPQTGKRKRIVKRGFAKERDAKKEALEVEYQFNSGNLITKEDVSFIQFSQQWYSTYSTSIERPVKESTLKTRRYALLVLNDYFNNVEITDIDHNMYQKFLFTLKKAGNLENTMKIINSTANMIFNKARKDRIIIQNPTEFTSIPREILTVDQIENQTIEEKYFEKDELHKFLNTAKKISDEDYVIFLVLAWTGLRIGELCALKWSDVNFEERLIRVTKTYYSEYYKIEDFKITPPKTKKSIREIEVEDDVIEVLSKHKGMQDELKAKMKGLYHDHDFIYARSKRSFCGYPIGTQSMRYRMKIIINQSGIKKRLSPHSLRHTHTSLLAEAGVGLPEIMARLGHKSDKTTTDIYLHVTKERRREASSKFGSLMRTQKTNQDTDN
ncbi:site-specific integrase [Sporosarcina sp. FSL K6-1508]|uniref:site-specific integrase n=1 Tax=Sporosarcina sp. FSL K6-1508 TaxID=2921553 RepID=UPI0030F7D08C